MQLFTITDLEYVAIFAVFAILLKFSIVQHSGGGKIRTAILQDTSTSLKAMCCLIIICHHYALRTEGGVLDFALGLGGGTYALSLFLMLSAYGIVRSEIKSPTTILQYMRKRVWKLFLPYLMVTMATIAVYWLVGGNCDATQQEEARVNPAFAWIGQHHATLLDGLKYALGVESLDGAMWFVGVTIVSYVAFLLAKQLVMPNKGITEKRKAVFIAYLTLLTAFAAFTYWQQFPAHYYRNLWALAFGMAVALWEKELLATSKKQKVVLWLALNVVVMTWLWITSSGGWIYMLFVNAALATVPLFNKLFKHYSLGNPSPIVWLATLSYMVYLVHCKLLTLQWWYTGYNSALAVVAASVAVAQAFHFSQKRILRQ